MAIDATKYADKTKGKRIVDYKATRGSLVLTLDDGTVIDRLAGARFDADRFVVCPDLIVRVHYTPAPIRETVRIN